jgi:protein arginine kinase activator
MNCEKCKNKKATVFYGDDGGGRHALCATCAESIGRLSESLQGPQPTKSFSPASALFRADSSEDSLSLHVGVKDGDGRLCPACATALSHVSSAGKVGCPECYTAFLDALFPPDSLENASSLCRMPRKKRNAIEKKRSIASLKQRIKLAVAAEDYELAATIRDEIKKLEART